LGSQPAAGIFEITPGASPEDQLLVQFQGMIAEHERRRSFCERSMV
jgi:hypothetical protein